MRGPGACPGWGATCVLHEVPKGIALPPGQAPGPHPAPHPPLVPTGPHSVVKIQQRKASFRPIPRMNYASMTFVTRIKRAFPYSPDYLPFRYSIPGDNEQHVTFAATSIYEVVTALKNKLSRSNYRARSGTQLL